MYQIGDTIIADIEGQKKEAEIVEIEKIFRETDGNGDFVEHGLILLESAIPTIQLPYEYHEDILIVFYPESKIEENKDDNKVIYRCKDHAYTLQIDDYRIVVGEEQLI
ncbi:hypothetical protein H1D32_20895 [Anaerobacillus sp. CMMVII]|uniref:hypothetical protein n=1 Tax=Anaerobacillus sp. CMMVII TaxID=2755588 RepID=UPI0021B813DD|nr:hypothetical protein [Anaerobacillus sp. CMMVII]MCT8139939.1 hypothetical protein [Anaerobacillus sp. CMMVII]